MTDHSNPFVAPYRNWKGITETRRLIPQLVRFGSTDWHPEPQWLLLAYDLDKQAPREFALKDFNPPASADLQTLQQAEAFVAGFEGDELQEGIDELLAKLRRAIEGTPDHVLVPREFLDFLRHAPVGSGTCCCGDDMEKHSDPMSCGHSPVDQWDHSLNQWLKQIEEGKR